MYKQQHKSSVAPTQNHCPAQGYLLQPQPSSLVLLLLGLTAS